MSQIIKASAVQVNQFIAIDFGDTIGIQWAKVEQVELNKTEFEPVVICVRMSKRFGSRYFEEFLVHDQLVAVESPADFQAFLKLYNLEF